MVLEYTQIPKHNCNLNQGEGIEIRLKNTDY